MSMKNNIFTLGIALIGVLNSCCNSNEPFPEDNLIRLEAVHPAMSRVTDTNFENNDRIGVYVVKSGTTPQIGGNVVNNGVFTYDGSQWNSEHKWYWDEGKHDVYAYYPYGQPVNDTKDYTFTVSTDQNGNDDNGMNGYEASDFLWAVTKDVSASESPVKLQFSHRMSNLVVKLQKGEDYEGELPATAEVYVHNTIPVASINLSTGDVSTNIYSSASTIKTKKISDSEFRACIVPQRLSTRVPLVEVLVDDISYLVESSFSFQQGYRHTFVVTLSKNPDQTKIEIGGSIGGWD